MKHKVQKKYRILEIFIIEKVKIVLIKKVFLYIFFKLRTGPTSKNLHTCSMMVRLQCEVFIQTENTISSQYKSPRLSPAVVFNKPRILN